MTRAIRSVSTTPRTIAKRGTKNEQTRYQPPRVHPLFRRDERQSQRRSRCRQHAAARSRNQSGIGVRDRKSVVEGKSVSVRVDLGGRRIINKKQTTLIRVIA